MTDGRAISLMDQYDIRFYRFDLEVTNASREVSGSAEIHASVLSTQLDTIVFQLSLSMLVDSLLVNGEASIFIHADQLLKIPSAIAPEQDFVVIVYYHGTPTGAFFKGIHRQYSSTYDRWVTWAFNQPFYAYKWFPCKQVHADKIDSVYMNLITDSSLTAVSSGVLHAKTSQENGKVKYEWRTKYAINYDLIFFAVSDYILYDYYILPGGAEDSIHITHYIYNQEYLDEYRQRLDSIGLFVDYFSSIFGPYPFADECFGLVVVPGVPSMVENNTLVTMIDELEFGSTHTFIDGNCHELTHQWFGDYVACNTYADIWLHEGFGMYGGYLGEQQFGLPGSAWLWLEKTRNEALSVSCGSVCVPEVQLNNASRIFNWQLSYCKGAMLLHMIRYTLIDDSLFFSVLQDYIEEHGNGTAVVGDFREVLEEKSGMDFTTFFEQWYYGEGHPILDVSWEQTGDTLHIYTLETTSCDITPFFMLSMDYQLILEDGDTLVTLTQNQPFEHYTISLDKQVVDIAADPEHWILAEITVGHVGISEECVKDALLIYPNPCRGKLYVKGSMPGSGNTLIRIYALDGRLMLSQCCDMETTLDLGKIPAGIYFAVLSNDDHTLSKKIIKR